jgi:capsular exopolysaccharide synthesis family protein
MHFDLGRLLRLVVKYRLLIGGVVAVALVLGLIRSLTATPLYESSATLETAAVTVQVMDDKSQMQPTLQDSDLATYVELMGSRSLAERVVDDLKLADDDDFVGSKAGPSLLGRLTRLLFERSGSEEAGNLDARREAAIGRIEGNTSAKLVKASRLLTVSFSDSDPARAQRIAHALATGFIQASLDRKFDATSYARRFLEDQLQQVKLKLEDSEKKVVAYADREKLVSLDNKQSLLSAQLENINTALAAAQVARSNAEDLWLRVKDAKDYSDIPANAFAGDNANSNSTGSGSVINQLRNTRSELVAQYQEKAQTFKPGFPAMVALSSRIRDVDAQIAEEMEKTKNSIHAAYDLAVQRQQSLEANLDETRQALIDARNRSVEYTMLQREADTNRTLYDGLLQRFKEISVVGGVASNGLSIVDDADLPDTPYSPKKTLNMLVALFLGLIGGVGVAIGFEYFDNTIKTPDQMEALLGIPVLGLIPVLSKNETMQSVLEDPHSAMSEAYRSARTALQFSTDQGVPKNFVVTSARPSEGKTTTAMTLARMFGQIGMKVLIIDADLRNPSLHKVLGIEGGAGLSNYLTGSAEGPEVLRPLDMENLTVMTSGPIPPNPAELLSSPKMLTLLTELSARFDLIIVDSAPVMGLADALLLSSVADGTLVVCAAGETPIETVKAAAKRIAMANGQILGGLLTKFNAQKAGYGYAYYGYDYYGYGKDNQKALPSA